MKNLIGHLKDKFNEDVDSVVSLLDDSVPALESSIINK